MTSSGRSDRRQEVAGMSEAPAANGGDAQLDSSADGQSGYLKIPTELMFGIHWPKVSIRDKTF